MSVNNVHIVSDALKYVNGMDVVEEKPSIVSDVKDSIFNPLQLVFGGWQVADSLKTGLDVEKYRDIFDAAKTASGTAMGSKIGTSSFLRSTNVAEQFKNTADNLIAKADKQAAEKALKAAKNSGKTGFFATIKKGLSTAGGAIKSVLSKIPGAGKVSDGLNWLKNTKFGKIMKGTGAVGMMAFEGVIGLVTEVIPAFKQGGAESGFKQLGKTALKTVASGLGWAGGTYAATALGAAIGSVFPGVGTIIGGAIGTAIGGILGSTICTGVAKKITGDSETEILKQKQFEETAAQVAQDEASMQELNQLVYMKLQEDVQNGKVDKNTEKMAEYINSGALRSMIPSTQTANAAQIPFTHNVEPQYQAQEQAQTQLQTENPYNYSNQVIEQNKQNARNYADYINQLSASIQAGDTSIYDISPDKLNSVFSTPNLNSSKMTTSVSDFTCKDVNQKMNYFAMA